MPFVIRKKIYYKNAYVQPTSPTGITATSGWENPSYAFDNNSSTYARCNTLTDYIEWDIGEEINLTGVSINGSWVSAQAVDTNFIIKSVNSSNVETEIIRTSGSSESINYISSGTCTPTLVSKLRFYIDTVYTNAPSRTIQINLITAPLQTSSSNYDYFEEVNIYNKLIKGNITYYKYVWRPAIVRCYTASNLNIPSVGYVYEDAIPTNSIYPSYSTGRSPVIGTITDSVENLTLVVNTEYWLKDYNNSTDTFSGQVFTASGTKYGTYTRNSTNDVLDPNHLIKSSQPIESTIDDYDFYTENNKYYVIKANSKYY